jgi:hypothetical protein
VVPPEGERVIEVESADELSGAEDEAVQNAFGESEPPVVSEDVE